MFKKIILGMMLMVISFASALTIEDLQKKLNHPVIKADFIQKRSLKGMQKPIMSSGQLIVSTQKGLYWEQLEPFKLVMILTENKLFQKIEDGKPEIITAKNNPQIFQFNQLLSSLFTVNLSELNQYFDLSISEKKLEWTVELIPTKEPINKIFKKIALQGKDYINRVELHDQQGDVTEIKFKDHQSSDALLDADAKKFKI